MPDFNPPLLLRNAHVQTLISSTPLRSWPLRRRTRRLQAEAIRDSMAIKPRGHDFDLSRKVVIMRHMSVTGG